MAAPQGHPNYDVNLTGGRPYKHSIEELEVFAEELLEWSEKDDSLYLKVFTSKKRIAASRLVEWAARSERFAEALEIAKDRQESRLFIGGLQNKLHPGTVKIGLSINHGWKEEKAAPNIYINGTAADVVTTILDNTDGKSKDLPINE